MVEIRIMKADNFGLRPAEREGAGRFIVHADEKLIAFFELESAIRAGPVSDHVAAESREKPVATRVDEVKVEP